MSHNQNLHLFYCAIFASCRRLWQHVTESLLQKDMEKATEHKRFLEERQRKEERHRTETETPWRTKYFERKVNIFINMLLNLSLTPISQFLNQKALVCLMWCSESLLT